MELIGVQCSVNSHLGLISHTARTGFAQNDCMSSVPRVLNLY